MLVLDRTKLDSTLYVEEPLARVLDMWATKTTPRALAAYVAEQLILPKTHYDEAPAISFLVELALPLTPPDLDKRMDFTTRCAEAARQATPWDFGATVATLMAIGWGGLRLGQDGIPTVRDTGIAMRELLHEKARESALCLLERWEKAGHVVRL